MATQKARGQNSHGSSRRGGTSQRGFAAMSKSQVRKIASMGGKASHGGQGRDYYEEDDETSNNRNYSRQGSDYYQGDENEPERRGRSRQGFAATSRDERREIASEGGRTSHGGRGRDYYNEYNEDYRTDDDRYNENERYASSRSDEYDDEYDFNDDDDDDSNETRYAGSDDDDLVSDNDRYYNRTEREDRYNEQDEGRRSRQGPRGFAAMDPSERRRVARMGGQASHRRPTSRGSGSRSRGR